METRQVWIMICTTLFRFSSSEVTAELSSGVSGPRLTDGPAGHQDGSLTTRFGDTSRTMTTTELNSSEMVKVCYFVKRSEVELSNNTDIFTENVTGSTLSSGTSLYESNSYSQSAGISSNLKSQGVNSNGPSSIGTSDSAAGQKTPKPSTNQKTTGKFTLIVTLSVAGVSAMAISFVVCGPVIRRRICKTSSEENLQRKVSEKVNWIGGNSGSLSEIRLSSFEDKYQCNCYYKERLVGDSTGSAHALGSSMTDDYYPSFCPLHDADFVEIDAIDTEEPEHSSRGHETLNKSVSFDIEAIDSDAYDSGHGGSASVSNAAIGLCHSFVSVQIESNGEVHGTGESINENEDDVGIEQRKDSENPTTELNGITNENDRRDSLILKVSSTDDANCGYVKCHLANGTHQTESIGNQSRERGSEV